MIFRLRKFLLPIRNGNSGETMGKKCFNDYSIVGDIAILDINYKGDILHTIIDLEDLQRLICLNIRWHVTHNREYPDVHYVQGTLKTDGKKSIVNLHAFLLNLSDKHSEKFHIDHINNDTLDNRKENLRKSTVSENAKNRNGKNKNNTSGYRNVSYSDEWYLVQFQIDGKNKVLRKFKNVEDAGKFAEEMRIKLYGEFSGKG